MGLDLKHFKASHGECSHCVCLFAHIVHIDDGAGPLSFILTFTAPMTIPRARWAYSGNAQHITQPHRPVHTFQSTGQKAFSHDSRPNKQPGSFPLISAHSPLVRLEQGKAALPRSRPFLNPTQTAIVSNAEYVRSTGESIVTKINDGLHTPYRVDFNSLMVRVAVRREEVGVDICRLWALGKVSKVFRSL